MASSSDALATRALHEGCRRRRSRCWAETTYTHRSLAAFVKAGLPAGWTVAPPPAGCVAPSGYPEVNDGAAQACLRAHLGVSEEEMSNAVLEDMMNGHCETVAVALSAAVVAAVHAARQGSQEGKDGKKGKKGKKGAGGKAALAAGHAALAADIQAASVEGQVAILFDAEARGIAHRLTGDSFKRRRAMWGPLMGPVSAESTCWPPLVPRAGRAGGAGSSGPSSCLAGLCAGFAATQERLGAAARLAETGGHGGGGEGGGSSGGGDISGVGGNGDCGDGGGNGGSGSSGAAGGGGRGGGGGGSGGSTTHSPAVVTLPLYVMNYIWGKATA